MKDETAKMVGGGENLSVPGLGMTKRRVLLNRCCPPLLVDCLLAISCLFGFSVSCRGWCDGNCVYALSSLAGILFCAIFKPVHAHIADTRTRTSLLKLMVVVLVAALVKRAVDGGKQT